MAKIFDPLNRVLRGMFKKSHRTKERIARRNSHNRSRGWSSIWRKRRRSHQTTTNNDTTRSSHRLLPSLFSYFKRRNNGLERGHSGSRRGSGLLRLVPSFMKKKDNTCTACSQWSHDEDNRVLVKCCHCNTLSLNSYILTLGGIHILVEASYPELDHTPADNAAGVPVNTCTAAVCHYLSTEPSPPAASQNIEEVVSTIIPSVSSTSEELDVSADVISLDWESSLESLVFLEAPSPHGEIKPDEVLEHRTPPCDVLLINERQPEISQSSEEQNIGYQLVYEMESDPCKMESDDDPIYRMEQSIAKIEKISHLFCYPDQERQSMHIKQEKKDTSPITCSWQWIVAVSVVFILMLLM